MSHFLLFFFYFFFFFFFFVTPPAIPLVHRVRPEKWEEYQQVQ